MTIRAIVFDFGGVLVRTATPNGRREWEDRLGLPAGELESVVHHSGMWIKAQRGQLSHAAYWQAIADNLGIPEADISQLQQDYFRDDQLDQALMTLIRDLRQRGYKIGLLSNDSAALEQKLRADLAIFDSFDAVVISANIGVMKPDPGAYEAICTALDVAANECVFIDDMRANIDGAEWFGMRGIRYVANMDLRAALNAILPVSPSP